MKKVSVLFMCLVIIACCLSGCSPKEADRIKIGVLKGPTGIGAIDMMAKSDKDENSDYQFSLIADATDIVARLTNGDLDIGALPTNTAANLYSKSGGDVQIIAINCLGVLYVLENGNSVSSIKDLKGKTIYVFGQGANPEYVLDYCLRQNGLEPGTDVDIQFKDSNEITAMMASGDAGLCMLPVPAATTVIMKNPDVRKALDMAEEYSSVSGDGSVLTMGCLVARKDFIEKHAGEVDAFLKQYQESVDYISAEPDGAAELIAQYGITGNAAVAKAAIPDSGIVCITGPDMKPALDGYLKVLYDASPASVGGKVPDDGFYY